VPVERVSLEVRSRRSEEGQEAPPVELRPRVELRVGDAVRFVKEGTQIATDAPGDADAGWTLSLTP